MTDVRTLLLTDVVDSTKLLETLGDAAMADLWARHDRVARDLLPVHNGREIDKTDGFLLLFDTPADAVAYAVAYHRGIAPLGVTARAGLHVGPLVLRENSASDVARGAKPLEVEGLAKPTAARVMSLAIGGQTLLTDDARQALGQTDLAVVSHGHWQLKGVSEPVELFEVGVPGEAPMTPPPDAAKAWRVVFGSGVWMPVREVEHSLPAERDAFVGRKADLQGISQRLDAGTRLLTVLGIGGTGKTRLVTHYGWTWLGAWPGGVWFCDLVEARSVDGILYAVARAMDVPLGKDDPVVQLGHAIAGRGRCLVILDNFEQVARHAQQTLGHWLDRADQAQFIVTSREVLGLRGERALPLAPLSTSEGQALFVERADAAKGGFAPSAEDQRTIQSLVTLLDGLPLAIELAAARVRMMPVRQIYARMTDRFKLLAGSGARQDRQATLRAAIDWSWELLEPWEKAALAQCSVFEGGFTLEATEAVLDLSAWPDAPWAMDVVQSLVDKSLVRRVSDERLGLLVSIHEYAGEKLRTPGGFEGSGTDAERSAWERHGAWYATLATDDAIASLFTHGGVERFRALADELDNLVAGCGRATARGDGQTATALLRVAWEVLNLRGPVQRGPSLAEAVLALPTLGAETRAHADRVAGEAAHVTGQISLAASHFAGALAGFRTAGNLSGEAGVLADLNRLLRQQGRLAEARQHCDAGLALARQARDRWVEGRLLRELGDLQTQQGQLDEARTTSEAALALAREVGDRKTEGAALNSLAIEFALVGRWDDACELFAQAVAMARERGDRSGQSVYLSNLAEADLLLGRLDAAQQHSEAALVLAREVGHQHGVGAQRMTLGRMHRLAGRLADARASFAEAERIFLDLQERYQLALLLGYRAELELDAGDLDAARTALAEAEALVEAMGAGPDSELGQTVARLRQRLAEGWP